MNMKKVILIVFVLIILGNIKTKAQGFDQGVITAGATVGQSYGTLVRVNGEYGVTSNIGLGIDLGYTTHEPRFTIYTLKGFLLTGSYHLSPQSKFDPYGKLGLGYFVWSNDSLPPLETATHKTGFGFNAEVGVRYFFTDNFALHLSAGYPYYFGFGFSYKFN